jgi:hypothetical protein
MAADSLLTIHHNKRRFFHDIIEFQTILPDKATKKEGVEEYISTLGDWTDNPAPPTGSRQLSFYFGSPFCPGERIKNIERDLPEIMIKTIIRRLRDLKRAYGKDNNMGRVDNEIFKRIKKMRCLENRIFTTSGHRYSHRQKKDITLNGIAGEIHFADIHPTLLPFLQSAEVVQVGKGTSWGLGTLTLDADPIFV